MTPKNKEQVAREIHKLEQDLENLERSYAAIEQGAWWVKRTFYVFNSVMVALILAGVVIDNLELSFLSLLCLFLSGLYVMRFRGARWIDVVSAHQAWDAADPTSSEARIIERNIADRKALLAALRGERS
jgi:hypothetical protein